LSRAIKLLYAPERPSKAIKFLYAPAVPPSTVWALPSWALVHKSTYAPMIYTALCIIYLGKWRGLGPGNLEFFGPQMAFAYQLDATSQGPKNSNF
jgi:hypothetical protein